MCAKTNVLEQAGAVAHDLGHKVDDQTVELVGGHELPDDAAAVDDEDVTPGGGAPTEGSRCR
jgi:hypothetical protein